MLQRSKISIHTERLGTIYLRFNNPFHLASEVSFHRFKTSKFDPKRVDLKSSLHGPELQREKCIYSILKRNIIKLRTRPNSFQIKRTFAIGQKPVFNGQTRAYHNVIPLSKKKRKKEEGSVFIRIKVEIYMYLSLFYVAVKRCFLRVGEGGVTSRWLDVGLVRLNEQLQFCWIGQKGEGDLYG